MDYSLEVVYHGITILSVSVQIKSWMLCD